MEKQELNIMVLRQREKRLEQTILDLVKKVRVYQEKYGHEYVGGKFFQLIIHDIEELGIKV